MKGLRPDMPTLSHLVRKSLKERLLRESERKKERLKESLKESLKE